MVAGATLRPAGWRPGGLLFGADSGAANGSLAAADTIGPPATSWLQHWPTRPAPAGERPRRPSRARAGRLGYNWRSPAERFAPIGSAGLSGPVVGAASAAFAAFAGYLAQLSARQPLCSPGALNNSISGRISSDPFRPRPPEPVRARSLAYRLTWKTTFTLPGALSRAGVRKQLPPSRLQSGARTTQGGEAATLLRAQQSGRAARLPPTQAPRALPIKVIDFYCKVGANYASRRTFVELGALVCIGSAAIIMLIEAAVAPAEQTVARRAGQRARPRRCNLDWSLSLLSGLRSRPPARAQRSGRCAMRAGKEHNQRSRSGRWPTHLRLN